MSGYAPLAEDGLRRASLPAALSDLTERVIRGTWLWPSEKRDLRRELESHFQEGLSELSRQGLSVEDSVALLSEDFGDPKLAAVLIRRGKKRGRPMIWKTAMTAVLMVAASATAGAGYLAYLFFGKPTPTVDYVAKFNEPALQTPEADRAWPILSEALVKLQPMPEDLQKEANNLPRPGDPLWQAAADWHAANRDVIPALTRAAAKPSYGFVYDNMRTLDFMRRRAAANKETDPVSDSASEDPLLPPTIALLLPHLADTRQAGRLLLLESRQRAAAGDFTAAWTSLDTGLSLALLHLDGVTVIEQLVGSAIARLIMQEMTHLLHDHASSLTADQLRLVQSSRLMTAPADRIRGNFNGELLFFGDVVQYVFTDDGTGNGRLIPSQFGKIASMGMEKAPTSDAELIAIATVHANRRETMDKFHEVWDRMAELYALPLYDGRRATGFDAVEKSLAGESADRRYALINAVFPSLSRADLLIRECAMVREGARVVVAMLASKLECGRLPQRLGELVPRYLDRIPTDAYSGEHLRYVTDKPGQVKVYSIGRNLKDDGGDPREVEISEPAAYSGTGKAPADIVFWPAK